MGLRFQKRVEIGSGVGLNLSKSGVSTSYRTKYGSISPKGFSIRTGIPGLTFRSSFGKSGSGSDLMTMLIVILLIGVFVFAAILAWNIVLFLIWSIQEAYHYILRQLYKRSMKREIEKYKNSDNVKFMRFSENIIPEDARSQKVFLTDILVEDGTQVDENTPLAVITVAGRRATLTASAKGKITFYKLPGEQLKFNECIARFEIKE